MRYAKLYPATLCFWPFLAAVGLLLYHGRDRTITDSGRSRQMFGGLL